MSNHFKHGRPTIGVLIGWHIYWNPAPYSYLNAIFRGVNTAISENACNLLLACGMGQPSDKPEVPHPAWPILSDDTNFVPVGQWNTDGLIVINPLLSETRSRYIRELHQAGHPMVFISNGEGKPSVVADNVHGISLAIEHLVKHGHHDIAFIGGGLEDPNGDSGERVEAYQSNLKKHGLNSDSRLLIHGNHSFAGGYIAQQKLLASGVSFTAVVASNDESAMGAMKALKEAGRRIPQDVAIIGFDDRPEAVAQVPPLTSIHVPLYESGYQAVKILLERINGTWEPAQSIKVSTRLTIRQSCGCLNGIDAAPISTKQVSDTDLSNQTTHILESMVEIVLSETHRFRAEEVHSFCGRLINSFVLSVEKNDPAGFRHTMDDLLNLTEGEEEDAHIWLSAISGLRKSIPILIKAAQEIQVNNFALDLLDKAFSMISEKMHQQYGKYILDQKWSANRIGSLTARLLMASNKMEILEVLAGDLPSMGINHASLAFFEAEQDDPVASSTLHKIPDIKSAPLHFYTREFPPEELYAHDEPFSLVLWPVVSPIMGAIGFIAYDAINIELDGPITQQIAAALNNARLYEEATEGRKLAEEGNRLKSRLLSTVSHELRTPLNLIVGLSEILLQKGNKNKRSLPGLIQKDMEQIYASAQHLGRLIQDVLDLASSEAGQLRLIGERVDLGESLEMVIATGRQLAIDKGLTWHDSLPETSLWVWGDRTRLRQVALNLVSNAVKFTSHGGIDFRLEIKDGSAVVSVTDSGLGIAIDEQSLIFDEFHRTQITTVRGYGGIGLGLSICKRLVEMQGGEIGVTSSGEEGNGSTFYFALPLIEPETLHIEERSLSFGSEQPILLLANHSASGERMHNHLINQGFKVQVAEIEQPEEWLSTSRKSPPGTILLDVGEAPNKGWHILKTLKEEPATRAVPVLLYSLKEEKGTLLELDYLTKPVGTAQLARVLEYQKLTSDEGKDEKVFLIVDDDPATLEMYVRVVQSWSGKQQVLKARNGREALELMQQHRPDLVLLDLMMPELDGFGVLEAMREKENTRNIPVIVLTGQMLTENEMTRLNRGVAKVLEKGLFSIEETLAQIDVVLAHKRKLSSEAQRLVRQAMAYMHEHYAQSISRQDLAHHLGLSGDYLTFCFRNEVGMAPIAYLNRYRINQAKLLLAESNKNITEIAMAVGFSDSGYFSRVFRRQVGISPDLYRRNKD